MSVKEAIAAREAARRPVREVKPVKKAAPKKAAPVEVIPQPAELIELASEPEA